MTPQTKQRILRAAREEFLRHGYGQAGLRRIAAAAHVTTGAVYNHFRSKHGLFDAIVRGPADLLLAAWTSGRPPQDADMDNAPPSPSTASAHSATRTADVLSLVYQHAQAYELLLCHAHGSEYADFADRLARAEEGAYRRIPGMTDSIADRLFLRTIASDGVAALRTALAHHLTEDEARQYMERIARFRLGGWAELLGPSTSGTGPAPAS